MTRGPGARGRGSRTGTHRVSPGPRIRWLGVPGLREAGLVLEAYSRGRVPAQPDPHRSLVSHPRTTCGTSRSKILRRADADHGAHTRPTQPDRPPGEDGVE